MPADDCDFPAGLLDGEASFGITKQAGVAGRKAHEYELWRRVAESPSCSQGLGEEVSTGTEAVRTQLRYIIGTIVH